MNVNFLPFLLLLPYLSDIFPCLFSYLVKCEVYEFFREFPIILSSSTSFLSLFFLPLYFPFLIYEFILDFFSAVCSLFFFTIIFFLFLHISDIFISHKHSIVFKICFLFHIVQHSMIYANEYILKIWKKKQNSSLYNNYYLLNACKAI